MSTQNWLSITCTHMKRFLLQASNNCGIHSYITIFFFRVHQVAAAFSCRGHIHNEASARNFPKCVFVCLSINDYILKSCVASASDVMTSFLQVPQVLCRWHQLASSMNQPWCLNLFFFAMQAVPACSMPASYIRFLGYKAAKFAMGERQS